MKRKIIALSLALIMVFSLSFIGCDDEEEGVVPSSVVSPQEPSSSTEEQPSSSTEAPSQEQPSTGEQTSSSEDASSSDEQSSSSDEQSSSTEPEPEVDAELQAKVDELLYSKHKLTYNKDGSFRVAIFADLHVNTGNATQIANLQASIKKIVDEQKPNLVIFTGDNTIGASSESALKARIDIMVSYLEQNQIPWCHVYGNHDHENALPNDKQQAVYESYEYCISKAGDDLSGVGNYVHGIYKADGALGAVIYCLDSGAYDTVNGGYDYIKEDQIAWYEETSRLLQEYNGGEVVYGMMAFHIPLIENKKAQENKYDEALVYEYSGGVNEAMCPSNTDTELLETIWERQDVKAIVTGHDHTNDYMFNYKGVKLTSSPTISEMGYSTDIYMGSRIFDLNASTITNIPTYVAYLIDRLNPEDYEIIPDNTVMNNFDSGLLTLNISGYDSGTMAGTIETVLAEGKGANGSDALKISRSQNGNFEISFEIDEAGRLGDNKYLIVWIDFGSLELRKACMGLLSDRGVDKAYRTDDYDTESPFYYLADGSDTWVELSHGKDGCFGAGDSGSQQMKGKKGYFAFPIENMLMGGDKTTENTIVSGFYLYADINYGDYANVPFYIDDIRLVADYKSFEK